MPQKENEKSSYVMDSASSSLTFPLSLTKGRRGLVLGFFAQCAQFPEKGRISSMFIQLGQPFS